MTSASSAHARIDAGTAIESDCALAGEMSEATKIIAAERYVVFLSIILILCLLQAGFCEERSIVPIF
jgi:hypothetical protein